tara:strand:- start:263 stop:595 length:333 start_codon:yes stop_codon:yes gene_type:complete
MLANISGVNTDCEKIEIYTSEEDGKSADQIILHVMQYTLMSYKETAKCYPDDFTSLKDWLTVVNQIIDDIDRVLYPLEGISSEEDKILNTENLRSSLKLYAEYYDEFWED